jgi:hypothetical protein
MNIQIEHGDGLNIELPPAICYPFHQVHHFPHFLTKLF